MEEEPQHVPFVIHIAQSDAAWLAAWAPDPRALGAHAMGLAALRGLLAEDMPKDGQPLGGEIQHARALIENARHVSEPIKSVTDDVESVQILRQRINDFGKDRARDSYRMETAFTYVENLEKRIAAVEEANAEMAHRLVGFGPPLQRIAALEEKAVRVSAEWRDRLAETNQRIASLENRCSLLENDAESAAGRIAALEAKS
ncbi:MAG: hypothetical protein KA170_03785 [Candidatus Promineofilum sp.]|nr:hypothetical protein [Promineifilum sp.]